MATTKLIPENKFVDWYAAINGNAALQDTLTSDVGVRTSLTTTDKTDLVTAINEIDGRVGKTVLTTSVPTVTAAINEVDAHADTANSSIGTLANLLTAEKTTVVGAVNELRTQLGTIASLDTDAIVDAVTAMNSLHSEMGHHLSLTTTDKTTIVAGINEIDGRVGKDTLTTLATTLTGAVNEHDTELGTLSALTTITKTSHVAAINELDAELGDTALATTAQTVTAAINEVRTTANTATTEIGTLSALTTTIKTSVVAAINEVDGHADSAQSAADTANTSIGTLASLTTTIKTDVVAAINEVDGHADAAQTTANTANTSIGTLASLTTTSKTDTVGAINEVAASVAANLAAAKLKADVITIQTNNTLNPTATPATGDRYIMNNAASKHANFGTITGLANGDIVQYNGTAFVIVSDASTLTESIMVRNLADSKYYTYDIGTTTWVNNTSGIESTLSTVTSDLANKLEWASVPATATSTGVLGQVAHDTGFIYVCTATNTWKRVAITTW